jgi:hypothetical protein
VFPRDVPLPPRRWIEDTYTTLILCRKADKGGHYAALEQPAVLVEELRTGLRSLRSRDDGAVFEALTHWRRNGPSPSVGQERTSCSEPVGPAGIEPATRGL